MDLDEIKQIDRKAMLKLIRRIQRELSYGKEHFIFCEYMNLLYYRKNFKITNICKLCQEVNSKICNTTEGYLTKLR